MPEGHFLGRDGPFRPDGPGFESLTAHLPWRRMRLWLSEKDLHSLDDRGLLKPDAREIAIGELIQKHS